MSTQKYFAVTLPIGGEIVCESKDEAIDLINLLNNSNVCDYIGEDNIKEIEQTREWFEKIALA